LYAIGRTLELLALTVFGDESILPPLLNLSLNFRHQFSKIGRTITGGKAPARRGA
jgi:hypothetical protein